MRHGAFIRGMYRTCTRLSRSPKVGRHLPPVSYSPMTPDQPRPDLCSYTGRCNHITFGTMVQAHSHSCLGGPERVTHPTEDLWTVGVFPPLPHVSWVTALEHPLHPPASAPAPAVSSLGSHLPGHLAFISAGSKNPKIALKLAGVPDRQSGQGKCGTWKKPPDEGRPGVCAGRSGGPQPPLQGRCFSGQLEPKRLHPEPWLPGAPFPITLNRDSDREWP